MLNAAPTAPPELAPELAPERCSLLLGDGAGIDASLLPRAVLRTSRSRSRSLNTLGASKRTSTHARLRQELLARSKARSSRLNRSKHEQHEQSSAARRDARASRLADIHVVRAATTDERVLLCATGFLCRSLSSSLDLSIFHSHCAARSARSQCALRRSSWTTSTSRRSTKLRSRAAVVRRTAASLSARADRRRCRTSAA